MEAPSTLAESLLDDLDELASDNEESAEINDNERGAKSTSNSSLPLPLPLLNDVTLQNHLRDIRASDALKNLNNKEHDEQDYNLIVKSNKQLSRIADELTRAHGELCLAYNPKFPELEELIPNPVQYKNAVSVIRTEMDISLVSDALNDILNSNQVLTVSVSGSMTSGRPLTMTELERVDRAIRYMDDILKLQRELSLFVERRMERLAPNAVTLIGAPLAAQLLGMAGGLEELSKIPSCNLQVMGQTKQTSSSRGGMSSSTTRPNEGLLVQCELVQQCPKSLQHKALKMVAAKTALAVRCDFVNQSTDASAGLSFRRQIEATFSKLLQPDKAPTLKSLPKPDLTIKKRRGGKRMRRLKEKYEETAMMKQANTRAFSAQAGEYGDDAMGLTRGLLDTSDAGGGALRKETEKRKMKYANTKASRKKAAQMNAKAQTNGLASSMVFTPVQGMELVNPDAVKDRVKEANKKWFSENGGFQSALPKNV